MTDTSDIPPAEAYEIGNVTLEKREKEEMARANPPDSKDLQEDFTVRDWTAAGKRLYCASRLDHRGVAFVRRCVSVFQSPASGTD
jgi:hypothetical protein